MDPIRVLAINGSMREPSHTRALTGVMSEALRSRGAIVDIWDVADPILPLAIPSIINPMEYDDENVHRLAELATRADASIWGSPIYHNSFTGALKNALDILHLGFFDHKTVGLLSHGGGRATQAVDQLRIVARAVGAIVIPTQVCAVKDDFVEDTDAYGGYRLESEILSPRIDRFADELLLVANAMRAANS